MQSPTADVEERGRDLFVFEALEKRREVGQARVPGLATRAWPTPAAFPDFLFFYSYFIQVIHYKSDNLMNLGWSLLPSFL